MNDARPLFFSGIGLMIGFFMGKKSRENELIHSRTGLEADGAPSYFVDGTAVTDLKKVSPRAWEEFVARMEVAPRNKISARYKLGAFQMDARRLADVGVMESARKVSYGPEMGVWMGKWTPPLSQEKFLGSMPLQYAAFVRSVRAAAPKVSSLVGKIVDGKPATLSGLLGVEHVAGAGVGSWVANPAERSRFKATTEMFHRTNGIF